jgi:hypothetical protein
LFDHEFNPLSSCWANGVARYPPTILSPPVISRDLSNVRNLHSCKWLSYNETVVEVVVKSLIWIVLILTLGFLGFGSWMMCSSNAWAHIHGDHDARLLGKWQGVLKPNYMVGLNKDLKMPFESVTFELKPNGKVEILKAKRYQGATYDWGSHEDEVQFKYLTVDYWPTPEFKFSVSADGNTVNLNPGNNSHIPGLWKRVP